MKNFGFGCMRMPMNGDEVDINIFSEMVDAFMAAGFNYFDTAHGYLKEKSEPAIREALVKRYPRESYILTDKLSGNYFETEEEIRPLFEKQLEACGVDYFDYYLMHAQNAELFEKYKKLHAYEIAMELKAEGKIRHMGISFHDTPEVLDRILTEYPQIEAVQIQFNYADYDDPAVQSRGCYEVCRKHGKPVIIMEPVKGGNLVNLPADAISILDALKGGSPASYAIRFAAGFEGVMMVLSGMSSMEQVRDNIGFMQNFKPLNEEEHAALKKVCAILQGIHMIPCTGCRYCVDGCPQSISIPDLFGCLKSKRLFNDPNASFYYHKVHTADKGKASDCIECGQCEDICPQHLEIRRLLKEVAAEFEKKK